MDFLNKAKDALSHNMNNNNNNNNNAGGQNVDPNAQPQGQPGQAGQAGGQQEDYGDKALDFIEKKTGHTLSRDQNETITDGVRNFYTKETGNQVNPKYSN